MPHRLLAISLISAALATPGLAQDAHVVFDWKWKNLSTGSQAPLGPGHDAAIWLDLHYSPAPGETIMVNSQSYTVLGLADIHFDLLAITVRGQWMLSGSGFGGTNEPNGPGTNFNYHSFGRRWDLLDINLFPAWGVGPPGTPVTTAHSGLTLGSIASAHAGQSEWENRLPNSSHPVWQIWRGRWTPSSYPRRSPVFMGRRAADASGTGARLWVYPTGTDPLLTRIMYDVPSQNIDFGITHIIQPSPWTCYGNCDQSTTPPILNVDDFICFIDRFAAGDPYANCDGSTAEPILNIDDFGCFMNAFANPIWCLP